MRGYTYSSRLVTKIRAANAQCPSGVRPAPHGRPSGYFYPCGIRAVSLLLIVFIDYHFNRLSVQRSYSIRPASVRRPSGAARTSVRPILSVRRPCGVRADLSVRRRTDSSKKWTDAGRIRAAPHGSARRRTANNKICRPSYLNCIKTNTNPHLRNCKMISTTTDDLPHTTEDKT